MKFTINKASEEDVKTIDTGLGDFNVNTLPAVLEFHWKKLNFGIYNEQGEAVGGILGGVGGWGGLYIKALWVHKDYRKQGLGAQLLEHMEVEGKELGGWKSQLDTFSFQAKDFYLKQGYEIFGTLKDFPTGHERYYMFKDL